MKQNSKNAEQSAEFCVYTYTYISIHIRIKSGEPGIPGFSMHGRLGGVICKPEGAA